MGTVKMDVEIGPATWTSELTATESTIEEDGDGLMKMDSLSEEQRDAVHTVLSTDANAFITGPAGTGKSYVLKMIAQELHLKGRKFEVLSTTGISAVDVGGTTIHSFTGIGIEDLALDDLQAVVEKSEEARTRWMESDLWIIDEVSMMHPKTFNNLDSLGRRIRRIKRPFGGIRVVMFGDFFQLPPISKGASSALTFCFETLAWRSLDIVVHTLTEPFRQKDEGFYRILSEARVGRLERESVSVLQSRLKVTLPTENGVEPTILYSKNDAVDAINAKKIAELKTEEVTYRSLKSAQGKFKGSVEHLYDKYFGNMRTPKVVTLKVGCQVIVTANVNIPEGICNGSRGVVSRFTEDREKLPVLTMSNGKEWVMKRKKWTVDLDSPNVKLSYSQIPLALGYAISIHKSQGMSLDRLITDLGPSVFAHGQAYVSLSRVRRLEGLSLKDFDVRSIKAHPSVRKFYEEVGGSKKEPVELKVSRVKPGEAAMNAEIASRINFIALMTSQELARDSLNKRKNYFSNKSGKKFRK
jgi:ATP-dependent DNA helicase PIF1